MFDNKVAFYIVGNATLMQKWGGKTPALKKMRGLEPPGSDTYVWRHLWVLVFE